MTDDTSITLIEYRLEQADSALKDGQILTKDLSKSFHKCFELRQASDYKVTEQVDLSKAKTVYQEAVVFVEAVQMYFKNLEV